MFGVVTGPTFTDNTSQIHPRSRVRSSRPPTGPPPSAPPSPRGGRDHPPPAPALRLNATPPSEWDCYRGSGGAYCVMDVDVVVVLSGNGDCRMENVSYVECTSVSSTTTTKGTWTCNADATELQLDEATWELKKRHPCQGALEGMQERPSAKSTTYAVSHAQAGQVTLSGSWGFELDEVHK